MSGRGAQAVMDTNVASDMARLNSLPVGSKRGSPLRHLDVQAVSVAARNESRSRENVVPMVSVFRWWARRTDAVTGALIDAVGRDQPGSLRICDPFAGGGAVALAALRRGHSIYAQDINPWAANGLAMMLDLPSAQKLDAAVESLDLAMRAECAKAYNTRMSDGSVGVITQTFRVMVGICPSCSQRKLLFPHALVTLTTRKERSLLGPVGAWAACRAGHLFETEWPREGKVGCPECRRRNRLDDEYTAGRYVTCIECDEADSLYRWIPKEGPRWRAVLVERTSVDASWKEIQPPTLKEQRQADGRRWRPRGGLGQIPDGPETRALLRHRIKTWDQLYPTRQLALLERSHELVAGLDCDRRTANAIHLAISGAGEMAGHLSRWDRYYLKSYEAMSGHRFNLPTLAVEPHVWGFRGRGRGGISRRLAALTTASQWWDENVVKERRGLRPKDSDPVLKLRIGMKGIGQTILSPNASYHSLPAVVVLGDSVRTKLADNSIDAIITDPPYHDDLHYDELSLPFRAWAGYSMGRLEGELIPDKDDPSQYAKLLYNAFTEMHRVLVPEGRLILTYANRDPRAWSELFQALQKAGFFVHGVASVHSENELDVVKRNRRTCSHDVVLDLTKTIATASKQTKSLATIKETSEADFVSKIANVALRQGRDEIRNYDQTLAKAISHHRFLRMVQP